jgi:hypothetical protein
MPDNNQNPRVYSGIINSYQRQKRGIGNHLPDRLKYYTGRKCSAELAASRTWSSPSYF